MANIYNKKYDYMADRIENLLDATTEALDNHWADDNFADAIRLVSPAHQMVQKRKIREWAKYLQDTTGDKFVDTRYFEAASYYGYSMPDIRNHTIDFSEQEMFKLLCNTDGVVNDFYWFDLDMHQYFDNLYMKDFIKNIYAHKDNENWDITLLCNPIDFPDDRLFWNNTDIMSEADWNKLDNIGITFSEYTNYVSADCSGYDIVAVANIIGGFDEDHSRWNGEDHTDDDCILGRLQLLHDDEPVKAFTIGGKISRIMTNTKLSYNQRYAQAEHLLELAEHSYDE